MLPVHHGRVGGVQPGVDPVYTGPTAGIFADQLCVHLLSLLQQGGVTQDLLETEVQGLPKVGEVYISSQCRVLQRMGNMYVCTVEPHISKYTSKYVRTYITDRTYCCINTMHSIQYDFKGAASNSEP